MSGIMRRGDGTVTDVLWLWSLKRPSVCATGLSNLSVRETGSDYLALFTSMNGEEATRCKVALVNNCRLFKARFRITRFRAFISLWKSSRSSSGAPFTSVAKSPLLEYRGRGRGPRLRRSNSARALTRFQPSKPTANLLTHQSQGRYKLGTVWNPAVKGARRCREPGLDFLSSQSSATVSEHIVKPARSWKSSKKQLEQPEIRGRTQSVIRALGQ
ncbi:hypothetical protein LIA77_07708 [Sarocladium implicatum]|nr:hypothetical protein LIA77_07708 [Sarocladium implicatum]